MSLVRTYNFYRFLLYIYDIPFDACLDEEISIRPITDESVYIRPTKFVTKLKTPNVKGSTCIKYQTDGGLYMCGKM